MGDSTPSLMLEACRYDCAVVTAGQVGVGARLLLNIDSDASGQSWAGGPHPPRSTTTNAVTSHKPVSISRELYGGQEPLRQRSGRSIRIPPLPSHLCTSSRLEATIHLPGGADWGRPAVIDLGDIIASVYAAAGAVGPRIARLSAGNQLQAKDRPATITDCRDVACYVSTVAGAK